MELRNLFFGEAFQTISQIFADFRAANPLLSEAEAQGTTLQQIEELRDRAVNLPQYLKKKEELETHLNLLTASNKCFKDRFYEEIAQLEQVNGCLKADNSVLPLEKIQMEESSSMPSY
jgi:hypothetical protein